MTRYLKSAVFCLAWFVGASFVLADERTPTTPSAEEQNQTRFVVDRVYENELVIPASGYYVRYGRYYRRPIYRPRPRYEVYRYPYGPGYSRYYYKPNYHQHKKGIYRV